ncbi:MAG: trypsin-like peptidase domain-containing protein [Firmicutes bacterium]|nr:trypsin-like peptidase domain-containing protein [Bacillota bacterium]
MFKDKYRLSLATGLTVALVLQILLITGVFFFAPKDSALSVRAGAAEPVAYASSPSPEGTDVIAGVVDRCSPAVVQIETTQPVSPNMDPFFRQFFGAPGQGQQMQQGLGSGFIINKDGYILTNEHVVSQATDIQVYLSEQDKPLPATLVGSDAELDLAVLKVKAGQNLPSLVFGDSDAARVGEWVIAIGNPYGLDHTVTSGVLSAKGRPITIENRQYKNLLQTDAAINPGNSGGPLLDLKGDVIGINTAINANAQGIGFAIPSSTVKSVVNTLITNGKISRPYMGVYLQNNNADLAANLGLSDNTGAIVAGVVPGSPAEKAGLAEGDAILKINGQKINTAGDITDLIAKSKVGDQVRLQVENKTGPRIVIITLAEK